MVVVFPRCTTIHSSGDVLGPSTAKVSPVRASVAAMLPFIGTEALQAGELTRGQLRWRYAALYPGVYVPKDGSIDLFPRAFGAWLWSGRAGVIAGSTAASLHIPVPRDQSTSVEMIGEQRRTPPGLTVRQERILDDEICHFGELPVTSPARTALDLARRLPRDEAVVRLDQLAAETAVTYADVHALAERYTGARGVGQAWEAIGLMDGGASSPRETLLRLALTGAGLPRPQTSIEIGDEWIWAFIAIGWPRFKVGVGFADNGSDSVAIRSRIRHQHAVQRHGWIDILVDDSYRRAAVLSRVREAIKLQRVAGNWT
jgi:hypothetical protein